MELRYMKTVTITVVFLTIVVCFALIRFPMIHSAALAIADAKIASQGTQSVFEMLKASEAEIEDEQPRIVEDEMKGHQIRLKLPLSVTSAGIAIESDYVNRKVDITIKGLGKDYFENYPMMGLCNNIVDITYTSENMVGVIELTLDDVLEVQMTSEDDNVYFDLVDPHEIYDYVVVVDAGHGGSVPGAYKMGVAEKDIDLAIVLELKKCFDRSDKNIGVYYTRTTDCNPSFAARVNLPNDADADLYLSVHNNSTASGRISGISGTEVMYRGADSSGESKAFASLVLSHLLDSLGSKNKGTVVGDDIYIIRESKAPVALVEVGFMTNKEELGKLNDSVYQAKTAEAIYDAVIEYLYD